MLTLNDLDQITAAMPGVRRGTAKANPEWRYHGRLIARCIDTDHLVIRSEFDSRDGLLRRFPTTFSVPARYAKHMMVVADLVAGDDLAIEDALQAAWQLQRSAD